MKDKVATSTPPCKLEKIAQRKLEQNNAPILFGTPKTDHVFAILSTKSKVYKLSWRSELIDSFIKELNVTNYLLGVDLDLVLFIIGTGEVLNMARFHSLVLDIQFHDGMVYIITQREEIRLIPSTFSVMDSYPPLGIFEKIELEDIHVGIVSFGGYQTLLPRTSRMVDPSGCQKDFKSAIKLAPPQPNWQDGGEKMLLFTCNIVA